MSTHAARTAYLVLGEFGDDRRSWVQVMPTGEKLRNGPWYFTVEAEDLDTYAASIREKGGRIHVDYDHASERPEGSSRAAGWFTGEAQVVKAGESRPTKEPTEELAETNELWAEVEWTPRAVEEIRAGEYRFMSPVFTFEKKDRRSGLMSKAREIVSSTLTNRPFFENMATVSASELLDSDVVDGIAELYGPDASALILSALGGDLDAVRSAVWTAAYMNDLPDSAFLFVEDGEKDSEGKTTPRSLRHFPYKNAEGGIDLPHLRNAIARIPQSNVSADKEALQEKARRILSREGGSPSAEDLEPKEPVVPEETPPTPAPPVPAEGATEMKNLSEVLGLPEHADDQTILAAVKAKDDEITSLKEKVESLQAQADSAKKLAERVADLEKTQQRREIESILSEEVRAYRVLPSETEQLAVIGEQAGADALKALVNARPPGLFAHRAKEIGSGGVGGLPDPGLQAVKREFSGDDPIDEESARTHLAAMAVLKEWGKDQNYGTEDYIKAMEQAEKAAIVF